jgi:hypothetical protein
MLHRQRMLQNKRNVVSGPKFTEARKWGGRGILRMWLARVNPIGKNGSTEVSGAREHDLGAGD